MKTNFSTPSLLFNLTIIFLSFHSSVSLKPTHHYCKKAAKTDPNFSYEFCVTFLDANPMSKNATLEELVLISVELTISNSTNIKSYISQLLYQKNMDTYTRGALKDCLELYSNANSKLHEAIRDSMKLKDYFKANLDVSAAMDSSSTCEDGFKEKRGVVSPLTKENNVFFQLTAVVLSFINMLS
ncbi:putative invertase inhibitor [Ricinus communis]|uniref:putative invertase inhibitor n=1 Tax=Ricinus communis TaxID=3988 RepID=UPI000772C2B8|nr:putative invertase inhibitor [Ricinus communis]|eukprot:XP_015580600.1 putative invertase inhibitor [Ricinus communis]